MAEESTPSPPGIIANGGWMTKHVVTRQRSVMYGVLARVWVFPSIGALFILGRGASRWLQATTPWEWLARLRLEEWVAFALLSLHIFFFIRARHWRNREALEVISYQNPNPAYKLDKLYLDPGSQPRS